MQLDSFVPEHLPLRQVQILTLLFFNISKLTDKINLTMGLFDYFKKKENQKEVLKTEKPLKKENEPYLGDLTKTNNLYRLVQTPQNERDDVWKQVFLENIVKASFRCGDPQVIMGPDGFPYFQLFLPEPNKSFQCYVIERMKDDFLLASGYGVVINPSQNGADWVLSYGDILNLHLNKTFYTMGATPFSSETNTETIAEKEEVLIGQPSEALLPQQTRQLLANLLKLNGINNPKILLLMRHKQGEDGGATQDIVFNLTEKKFADENTYRSVMQAISWYLPRHYSIVGMDEESLGSGFMPL